MAELLGRPCCRQACAAAVRRSTPLKHQCFFCLSHARAASPLPPRRARRHALGGALATLSAALLQSWTPPATTNATVAAVYTFGSPRVGSASWAQAYWNLGLYNYTLRYVYSKDVIPLIPQDSTPG